MSEEVLALTAQPGFHQKRQRAQDVLMMTKTLTHPFRSQDLRTEMVRQGYTEMETTEILLFLLEHNMLVANADTQGEVTYGLPDRSVSPFYLPATASGVRLTASQINEDAFGQPMIELRIEGKSGRPGKFHEFSYEALLALIAQANDVRSRREQQRNEEQGHKNGRDNKSGQKRGRVMKARRAIGAEQTAWEYQSPALMDWTLTQLSG